MGFRYNQTNLVSYRVDAATMLRKYDMVWLDTDDVKPANDYTWDTNLATTQGTFASKFVGICWTPSAVGDTHVVSIDVSGVAVYEFACASAAYAEGATVGPDAYTADSPDYMMDQQLEAAAAAASIARVIESVSASSTRILVSFASAYTTASSNVNANIG